MAKRSAATRNMPAKVRSGGGITGKNVRNVTASKAEPKSKGVDISTLGRQQTAKGYNFARDTKGYNPKGPTSMSATGPGAGRDVHKSGSQHGLTPAKPLPAGRSFDD